MKIILNKSIPNIKFPKIIFYNKKYYIYGIKTITIDEINKFYIILNIYNDNFDFIEEKKIDHEFKKSTLIWDIIEEKNNYIFLIEQKSIDKTIHSSEYYNYYIEKENLDNFNINKIEKLILENHLISKIRNEYIFTSKIEVDEERPDYYWGKYLFLFYKNLQPYKPIFDNIVNYLTDKGHILHYIEKINKEYFIIFSIRHKYSNSKTKYYYKIYSAKSNNLKYFYNTKEIIIENNLSDSVWYCYPEIFKNNNIYYIIVNQDDFGKQKKSLVGILYW